MIITNVITKKTETVCVCKNCSGRRPELNKAMSALHKMIVVPDRTKRAA